MSKTNFYRLFEFSIGTTVAYIIFMLFSGDFTLIFPLLLGFIIVGYGEFIADRNLNFFNELENK